MNRRSVRACLIAAAGGALLASSGARTAAQSPPSCGLELKVLVMSGDGSEADLPAIESALDYLGTPYDVYVATDHPEGLEATRLADGCHAFYQGVILTTDNLVYAAPDGTYQVGLTPADADTLDHWETSFAIRQVTWYTYPTPALGFNYPTGASGDPFTATLTARGAQVFGYLRDGVSIPIQYSWTYLTTPLDGTTTPLLTDAEGHSLAAIHVDAAGRENLAMTFDSNPYLTHDLLLSYGVVNWVTKGLFIGDRHTYVSPQVDDIFIDDEQWLASTACGTDVDATGATRRIGGADLSAVAAWQDLRRAEPQTADLRVTMAFNGYGTTSDYSLVIGHGDRLIGGSTGGGAPDTLTPAAVMLQQKFLWVSHTFDHENLDAVSYAAAAAEITQNLAVASTLGFSHFAPHAMVQPDVSGLTNPAFLQAAWDNGLRYLVSDTSRPGQDNPSPNVGFPASTEPGIFVIPRRANNLFFNVATPDDWVAEYNCHYHGYWGRDLTYAEVLDKESDQLVADMLRGELDPWMFHQTNLAAYDGVHTLLGDLVDAALAKYEGYENLPILSPSMETVGARMAARTALRTHGLSATLQPGVGLVLESPVDVIVPVTGLDLPGAELYGGQRVSWVALTANTPTVATYSIGAPSVDAGPAQDVAGGTNVILAATASDPNRPPLPITYGWTQTGGPAVALTNPTAAVTTFVAPSLGAGDAPLTLSFAVTASNGFFDPSSSTTVTVEPPVALTSGGPVGSDGTGTRTTAPFAVGAGDLVVAFVSADGPARRTQTATVSGADLTWTLAARSNGQPGTSEVWTAWAADAIPGATVTATLRRSSATASLVVMTFAGAGGVGASAAADGATGAPSVALTTTGPRSFVFGVGNDPTAAVFRTAAADQQIAHEYLGGGDSHWVQTPSAGAVPAAGTGVLLADPAPATDGWNFAAVEILASQPAAISSVRAATTNTAAVVTWTTNVPSASRVDYGSSPDALTRTAGDGALVTSHAVALHGLTTGATYHFRVTSVDAAWTSSTSPVPPDPPLSFVAANPAGLVAAFDFGEGAGTTVTDLSGNGNEGAIAGAAWTAAGRYGQGLSFDGASNWITVEDSPSLTLTSGMTIEAWVNPASLTGWQSVLYKERPDPAGAGLAWALYSSDFDAPPAAYAMLAGATDSAQWTHVTGRTMLPLGTWSHLAATFDGSRLRLYVNGALVRTLALAGNLTPSSGPLRIGGNSPSIPFGGQFFNGLIDEIRVYDRALGAAEIQADMATPLP